MSGVAPGAKIMPVVLFDNGGWYVGDDYAAKGIIWAVNNGANVLSNSWGGAGYSQTLKDAFDYALERGVVVVAAAGNSKSITILPISGELSWSYTSKCCGIQRRRLYCCGLFQW